ncbi:hypothetical protein NLI96_g3500 [Meripilus lineatus]|uniref:Reverse transcriptase n=1 Tax=Meripilus lineatus TaxID=2056292 RepID=A0AAD5V850_9APHY|nr:hypothetical protein NLI96_g3500 [Physisporinus lineatus]
MCQHHYLSPAVSVLTKPEPAEEPLTLWFLTPHNSMGSDDLIVIPRPKTPPFSASSLLLSATIATEPVKPERRIQTSPTNLIEAPSKDPYRGFKLEILPPLGTTLSNEVWFPPDLAKGIPYAHRLFLVNPNFQLRLRWIPSHQGVCVHNDDVDKLAGDKAKEVPPNGNMGKPTYLSYAKTIVTGKNLKRWRADRRGKWPNNRYQLSDKEIQPSHTNPKFLETFGESNKTTSRAVRGLTGHAPIGSYYHRFKIKPNAKCPCGATLESPEHVVWDCTLHPTRDLLRDVSVIRPDKLLWMRCSGPLNALYQFIKHNRKAFDFSNAPDPGG